MPISSSAGLLHGIEVANGADMSDEAFKIALDNNLTILGTSDIHGLIDWDYDLADGGHRTATLVLTKSETSDGLKAALKAGDTVAIYNDNLIGKKANVEAVVRSTLKMEVGEAAAAHDGAGRQHHQRQPGRLHDRKHGRRRRL